MSAYFAPASSAFLDWDLDEYDSELRQAAVAIEIAEPPDQDYFQESWYGQFELDQYDWNDPKFVEKNRGPHAYCVIPLTQGYFMIVSPHDYKRMTQFPNGRPKKWHANVQRSPLTGNLTGIYGRRSGRADEPSYVYAHRELIGCLQDNGVVDHMNGWGLDNRRGTPEHPVNLRYTGTRENGHNAIRSRTVGLVLPRGVEPRRKNGRGQQLYGGMYCKRYGKKVKTIRSKRVWLTPEPAALWYQNQMQKLHQQRSEWSYDSASVSYPEFPRFVPGLVPF